MDILLWALIGIMAVIIIVLVIRIVLLRKSAKEIETAFADRLITDTNTRIDISSQDKCMRSLAASINVQLRKLREEHHRFVQGDTELKNAVTNISHDLRTPLTAISGYLDLLEKQEKSEETERYLSIIRERCENLKHLTEELFKF
ncbi:MAG: histidine kinase [Eubacterium sp.]|nr:histidine kinase [Eubacterium sp.]